MQPIVDGRVESLADAARAESGLATAYRALDHLVTRYGLHDAALVVDVPGLGRQVLHAGRRPLHNDERGLHDAAPGLYVEPATDELATDESATGESATGESAMDQPLVAELMQAIGALGLRYDTRARAEGAGEESP
jgi:hypothetical protein